MILQMLNHPINQNVSLFGFFRSFGKILGLFLTCTGFSLAGAQFFIQNNAGLTIIEGTVLYADSIIYQPEKIDSVENKTKIYIVKGTITSNFPGNDKKTAIVFIDTLENPQKQIPENLTSKPKEKKEKKENKIAEAKPAYIEKEQDICKSIPGRKHDLLSGKNKVGQTSNISSSHKKHFGIYQNTEEKNKSDLFQTEKNNFRFTERRSFSYVHSFSIRPPPVV